MKENLYHYTKINSFEKIVNCNGINFSKVTAIRDRDDEGLEEVLKNSLIKRRNDLKNPEKVEDLISTFINERRNSYICCFSLTKENDYLWDKYADKDTGVCIEFIESFFPPSPRMATSTESYSSGEVKPEDFFERNDMLYGEEYFSECIDNIFKNNKNLSNGFIFNDLLRLSDSYKKHDHCKEKEHRIIYYGSGLVNFINQEGKTIFYKMTRVENSNDYLTYRLQNNNQPGGILHAINKVYVKNNYTYNKIEDICRKFYLKLEKISSN